MDDRILRTHETASGAPYIPDPAPEHYTAWITTDRGALSDDHADVAVLQDELLSQDGGKLTWGAAGKAPVFYAETTAPVTDYDAAIAQAKDILREAGWSLVGDLTDVPTGYIVTVERTT